MTQGVTPYPRPRASFEYPVAAPDSEIDDGDIAVICFSEAWKPYVVGALKQLLLQSTWEGDASTVETALGRATDLVAKFQEETIGCPEIMVVKQIRYNVDTDHVQTDFTNTDSWTNNDSLDPRTSDAFKMPPRVTGDPKCDAAEGMTQSFKGFIDAGINWISKEEMVGALVDFLLLFIPEIGIFIALILGAADALLEAGATALTEDFTTEVYARIKCYFDCSIGADGSINAAQLTAVADLISVNEITLVSVMFEIYRKIVGLVGLQNAGVVQAATGDCTDCACGWIYEWDFTVADGGFTFVDYGGDAGGTWSSGNGWEGAINGSDACGELNEACRTSAAFDIPADCTITEMDIYVNPPSHTSCSHIELWIGASRTEGLTDHFHIYQNSYVDELGVTGTITEETGQKLSFTTINIDTTTFTSKVRVKGTGTPPDFSGGNFV